MITDMKIIGSRIRVLRDKTGLTQKHIANFIGVDQSLISKFEAGERAISTDMIDKLSALFCCPVSELVSEINETSAYGIAFRANDLDDADLFALASINKIVLNQMQMDELGGGLPDDK